MRSERIKCHHRLSSISIDSYTAYSTHCSSLVFVYSTHTSNAKPLNRFFKFLFCFFLNCWVSTFHLYVFNVLTFSNSFVCSFFIVCRSEWKGKCICWWIDRYMNASECVYWWPEQVRMYDFYKHSMNTRIIPRTIMLKIAFTAKCFTLSWLYYWSFSWCVCVQIADLHLHAPIHMQTDRFVLISVVNRMRFYLI